MTFCRLPPSVTAHLLQMLPIIPDSSLVLCEYGSYRTAMFYYAATHDVGDSTQDSSIQNNNGKNWFVLQAIINFQKETILTLLETRTCQPLSPCYHLSPSGHHLDLTSWTPGQHCHECEATIYTDMCRLWYYTATQMMFDSNKHLFIQHGNKNK